MAYGLPANLPMPDEIDQEIENGTNNILQRVDGGKVKAFIMLALEEGGNVTVNTSTQVKPYVHSLMLDWARSHLARTYESAVNDEIVARNFGPAADVQFPFGYKNAAIAANSPTASNSGSVQAPRKPKGRRATPYRTMKRTRAALSRLSATGPSKEASAAWTDAGGDSIPTCKQMYSFRVNEEDKVKNYLEQKLDSMQQNPDKYIAKAWIKGICPKKQAKFPYKCKQRLEKEGKNPEWPGWWPIEVCEFKEPDHIVKPQRIALCLHLLRLRPTPEQLDLWHGETREPNRVHIEHGWTAFLKDLAPPTVIDELEPERPEKAQCLRRELERMYKVAYMEENYKNGGCDCSDLIQLEDDELILNDDLESRASKPRRSKRLRVGPERKDSAKNTRLAGHLSSIALRESVSSDGGQVFEENDPPSAAADQDAEGSPPTWNPDEVHAGSRGPAPGDLTNNHEMSSRTTPDSSGSLTTSFGTMQSNQAGEYDLWHSQDGPTAFPGRPDFAFPRLGQGQGTIQVHQMSDIPYPRFDTVHNTPALPPMNTMHFQPHDRPTFRNGLQPTASTFGAPYSTTMPPYQMPVPAMGGKYDFGNSMMGQELQQVPAPSQSQQMAYPGQVWQCPQGVPSHSLPISYHQNVPGPPNDDVLFKHEPPIPQGRPFAYEEQGPDTMIPAAALPGSVERGFTGHGSGIGGGAWV